MLCTLQSNEFHVFLFLLNRRTKGCRLLSLSFFVRILFLFLRHENGVVYAMVFTTLVFISGEQCRNVVSRSLHEVVESMHSSHRPQASQGIKDVLLILAVKKVFPIGFVIFDENPHVCYHDTEQSCRNLFESVG